MCSEHNTPVVGPEKARPSRSRSRPRTPSRVAVDHESVDAHSSDLEKDEHRISEPGQVPMLDMSHYKMIDQVWHFCSVDWGAKCKPPININVFLANNERPLHWI